MQQVHVKFYVPGVVEWLNEAKPIRDPAERRLEAPSMGPSLSFVGCCRVCFFLHPLFRWLLPTVRIVFWRALNGRGVDCFMAHQFNAEAIAFGSI